jgi:hypothetical protein
MAVFRSNVRLCSQSEHVPLSKSIGHRDDDFLLPRSFASLLPLRTLLEVDIWINESQIGEVGWSKDEGEKGELNRGDLLNEHGAFLKYTLSSSHVPNLAGTIPKLLLLDTLSLTLPSSPRGHANT